jgi:outer membrane protein assembly factor BamB
MQQRDLSRSRAVLIGNGAYRPDSGIPDLPAAGACVAAMTELLTSDLCGWPRDRIEPLVDVARGSELARRLTRAVADVRDVLLVYYVGRGLRTGEGQLALALADSDASPGLLPHTALLYEDLAEILRCPAASKLVILDCGHAELAEPYPVDGLYLIGAGAPPEEADAPAGGPLTSFTTALVDVVRTGVPGGPPLLTMDQLFEHLRGRLPRDGLPGPVEIGRGVGQYAFAYNAAPPATPETPQSWPPPTPGWTWAQPVSGDAPGYGYGPVPGYGAGDAPAGGVRSPALTRRRLVIGVGAAAAAAGLGTAIDLLLPSSGGSPQPVPLPMIAGRPLWTSSTLAGNSPSDPMIVADTVYLSNNNQSSDGTSTGGCAVYALDATTGTTRWTARVGGATDGLTRPTVAGTNLVVATYSPTVGVNAFLYALDVATGAQRWNFTGDSGTLGTPAAVNGTVYTTATDVATANGSVYALNAATGAQVWKQSLNTSALVEPVVVGGAVYLAGSSYLDGTPSILYALDAATGARRWTSPSLNSSVLSNPVVAGATVYVGGNPLTGTSNAFVYALDAATGALRWTSPALNGSVLSAPVIVGDTVYLTGYVSATSNFLYALDVATGARRWQLSPAQSYLDDPIVTNDVVYVGAGQNSGSGALYALDIATGAQRWKATLTGNGVNNPTLRGTVLYVAEYDQNAKAAGTGGCAVSALSAGTGERKWRLPLSGRSLNGPVVDGTTLYVAALNTDGRTTSVYAVS